VSVADRERWRLVARKRGQDLSTFIRSACDAAATCPEQPTPVAGTTTVVAGGCPKRVPRGAYCKTCGRVHR
jgi:hypothetical protein